MIKRLLVILAFIAPGLALLLFYLKPAADNAIIIPIAHFYVVAFTTFSAMVISILLAASLGTEAKARHVLAATGFGVIGSVFFLHGLATPGALINYVHPALGWSAWLSLFAGGLLFAIAGLDGPNGLPRWLPLRMVNIGALCFVLLYSAIAIFAPGWLSQLEDLANPMLLQIIFWVSLVFLGFGRRPAG